MNKENALFKKLSLSYAIANANFKTRNQGSYLGILWYLLEPLLFFLVLMFLRSHFKSDIQHYGLYLFSGLIMFNLFSKSTSAAVRALLSNAQFIKSINISYVSLVVSTVLQTLLGHFYELIILFALMLIYQVPLIWLLLYPVVLVFYLFFILGLGFFLAVLGIHFRDISNIWTVFCRVLWFSTPIFYVLKVETLQTKLNPVYYYLKITRDLIINQKISEPFWLIGAVVLSLVSMLIGVWFFNVFKKGIAEKI